MELLRRINQRIQNWHDAKLDREHAEMVEAVRLEYAVFAADLVITETVTDEERFLTDRIHPIEVQERALRLGHRITDSEAAAILRARLEFRGYNPNRFMADTEKETAK